MIWAHWFDLGRIWLFLILILKLPPHTCWNKHFKIQMSSKDKNITGISIYIKLDYWYVSHSKKCQYRIVILDREILPGPEDAHICSPLKWREISLNFKEVFYWQWLSVKYFFFWKLKSTMCRIGALSLRQDLGILWLSCRTLSSENVLWFFHSQEISVSLLLLYSCGFGSNFK